MDKLFLYLMQLSLKACVVIPFIIAVRFLIRKQPKIYSYFLWAVVFIGLIADIHLPQPNNMAINTPVSQVQRQLSQKYENLMESYTEDVHIYYTDDIEYYRALKNGIEPLYDDETDRQYIAASVATQQTPLTVADNTPVISCIWFAGVLMAVFVVMKNHIAISYTLKYATHYNENIYIAENLPSPFVFGMFNPKIYIPESLRLKDLSYVITHEQTHIRRKDHIIKPICLAILILHWFNPLVWVAFRLMCTDMEMSCDEKVVDQSGTGSKKSYSLLLLDFATDKSMATAVLFGENHAENRIKNVLGYKKPAKVLATVLTAVVVVCFVIPLLSDEQKMIPPQAPATTFYEIVDSKNDTDHLQYRYRMGVEGLELYRHAGETVCGDGVMYQLKHQPDTYTVPDFESMNLINKNTGLLYSICLGNRLDDGSRPQYSICIRDKNNNFAIYDYTDKWTMAYKLELPQGCTAGIVIGHDKLADNLYITTVTAKDADGNTIVLIYHTKDGNRQIVYEGLPFAQYYARTVRFLNDNIGFASFRENNASYPTAKITVDGGRTWQSLDFSSLIPKDRKMERCLGCIVNIYGNIVELRYHTYETMADNIGRRDDSYAVISTDGGLTWAGYARGGTRQTDRRGMEYIKVTEDIPVMLMTEN